MHPHKMCFPIQKNELNKSFQIRFPEENHYFLFSNAVIIVLYTSSPKIFDKIYLNVNASVFQIKCDHP